MVTLKSNLEQRHVYTLTSLCFLTALAISPLCTPYMSMATFSYLLLCSGLFLRHYRNTHAKLMITAILIDFSLVLVLEFTRGATQTALSLSLTPLQQVHIISSSIATLLYLPILILGWKRWNGSSTFSQDQWHLKLGLLAFIFRTIGFILMFTLLNHVGRL